MWLFLQGLNGICDSSVSLLFNLCFVAHNTCLSCRRNEHCGIVLHKVASVLFHPSTFILLLKGLSSCQRLQVCLQKNTFDIVYGFPNVFGFPNIKKKQVLEKLF